MARGEKLKVRAAVSLATKTAVIGYAKVELRAEKKATEALTRAKMLGE
jgi:alpha-D-ribose 1-methylphosphonate 5-triphosphate synthase subunit PhnG